MCWDLLLQHHSSCIAQDLIFYNGIRRKEAILPGDKAIASRELPHDGIFLTTGLHYIDTRLCGVLAKPPPHNGTSLAKFSFFSIFSHIYHNISNIATKTYLLTDSTPKYIYTQIEFCDLVRHFLQVSNHQLVFPETLQDPPWQVSCWSTSPFQGTNPSYRNRARMDYHKRRKLHRINTPVVLEYPSCHKSVA